MAKLYPPHTGYEQRGKRPALVLSPKIYNEKTSLCVCVPITSKVKGYPFEVAREAVFICTLPDEAVQQVQKNVWALVG